MKHTSIFDEIKSQITVVDFARQCGLPVNKEGNRTASFIDPGNNKTCVVYYNDFWYDFKVNEEGGIEDIRGYGDVIDLCAILKHDGNIGDAIREFKIQFGIVDDFNLNSDLITTDDKEGKVDYWHKELYKHPEVLEHIHERNISDKTIKELKIGFSKNRQRIMIPYYKYSYPVSWIGRTVNEVTDDNPKYFKPANLDGYMNVIWGLNTLNRKTPLVITEGAFDALSLYDAGYAVIASMGSSFSKQQKKELVSISKSKKFDYVILAFDNDSTGKKSTFKYANLLLSYNVPFKVLNIPKSFNGVPVKDISDYYKQAKELDSLVKNNSVEDLAYFAQAYKDSSKEEFKKFAYKLAKLKDKDDVNYFIDKAMETTKLDPQWMKELKKSVHKINEKIESDEILRKYELVFNEKLGLYQFNGKIWERKTDTHLKNLVSKQVGKKQTNANTAAISGLVKAKCNADNIEFNKKNIITFKNGVLELDSGVFRSFNKNDYSTIQLGYEYSPDSECPKFLKFLDDITNSNQGSINLLQEMTGYCLFLENSLHTAFYFYGEGANGKSVYLKVIESLFGVDNISHVAISGLNSEFQRIEFMDSMVNIVADYVNQKFTENCIGYLRSIIANDAINGCYKGLDFVNFTSRAKLFFASNEDFKVNDTSDGMKRRMIFMDFPVQFVENPTSPNEKKIDRNITNKLLKELPGIFNWAYEGYKRLKENQKFTETEETKMLKEDFVAQSNPIVAFTVDYEVGNKDIIYYDEVYKDYKNWCLLNSLNNDLSQRKFIGKFSKPFLKKNPNWDKAKKNNKCCFKKIA